MPKTPESGNFQKLSGSTIRDFDLGLGSLVVWVIFTRLPESPALPKFVLQLSIVAILAISAMLAISVTPLPESHARWPGRPYGTRISGSACILAVWQTQRRVR